MDDLQPDDPRWIGTYRLEKRLGGGGMGLVYLGRSPGGRLVAIKVIRAELASDPEFRTRFAREVTAARKVSGVFTAEVLDADLHGPAPWLATSYVAGPSLEQEVSDHGPLPAASVTALAAGLAEGLNVIHAAGVVHRDLKPANVLLAADGPRLIDFGISRSAEMSPLTRTGMVIGSPGFMSPEQATGREVGPPSDIFSLGAVLVFAAAGREPFGAGSNEELLDRVVRSRPDTGALPGGLRALAERCLAKDPRRRPTAAGLLAELSPARPTASPGPVPSTAIHPATVRAPARGPAQITVPVTRSAAAPPSVPAAPGPRVPAVPRPRVPAVPRPRVPAGEPPLRQRPEPRPGHKRSRRGWLILAVVLLVGAAALAAARAGLLGGHAPSRPAPPATSSTATASPASPREVMAVLGSYLARSASVRPDVQRAVDGVRTCALSPAGGRAELQRAIGTRQDILGRLGSMSPAGLPDGTRLIGALATAMRDSIQADRYYQNWMSNFENSGSVCPTNPSQDSAYLAGQDASAAATTAKQEFTYIWNPLAPRYGQRTYSSGDF
jgi:protein kinase-like protein